MHRLSCNIKNYSQQKYPCAIQGNHYMLYVEIFDFRIVMRLQKRV